MSNDEPTHLSRKNSKQHSFHQVKADAARVLEEFLENDGAGYLERNPGRKNSSSGIPDRNSTKSKNSRRKRYSKEILQNQSGASSEENKENGSLYIKNHESLRKFSNTQNHPIASLEEDRIYREKYAEKPRKYSLGEISFEQSTKAKNIKRHSLGQIQNFPRASSKKNLFENGICREGGRYIKNTENQRKFSVIEISDENLVQSRNRNRNSAALIQNRPRSCSDEILLENGLDKYQERPRKHSLGSIYDEKRTTLKKVKSKSKGKTKFELPANSEGNDIEEVENRKRKGKWKRINHRIRCILGRAKKSDTDTKLDETISGESSTKKSKHKKKSPTKDDNSPKERKPKNPDYSDGNKWGKKTSPFFKFFLPGKYKSSYAVAEEPPPPAQDLDDSVDGHYEKIATKLEEMVADSSEGASANREALTDLEREILECLRIGGDRNSMVIDDKALAYRDFKTREAYDRFRCTLENSLGKEVDWNYLAFLFHTTKCVVKTVGKGTKLASKAMDFTVHYVADTCSSWIVDQGGFENILEEVDYDLD
ncbi:uncharacterized protein LOC131957185 [Physella acuta]|uniref:uncharacterized protein LOC131957185 n=1 Tax=Physella acuta TaxID=109671 RepID=UPI0027DDE85A|nr:uncharacterized protein LOC131957185 [Physella acuta]